MTSPDSGAPSARRRTLAEKVWDDHLVVKGEDGQPDLIYIDLHPCTRSPARRPSTVCAARAAHCAAST